MLNKVTAGLAALAAIGWAGAASAQQIDEDTYNVNVNIDVAANVSMWAADENVNLVLDGGPTNSDFAESSISHINNVAADISVEVLGNIPAPSVPGGGVLFYVFKGMNAATAEANLIANNYAPAGALVWTSANQNTPQPYGSVGTATSIASEPVVYAAATPGELPLPQNFDLDVVWQITAQP